MLKIHRKILTFMIESDRPTGLPMSEICRGVGARVERGVLERMWRDGLVDRIEGHPRAWRVTEGGRAVQDVLTDRDVLSETHSE